MGGTASISPPHLRDARAKRGFALWRNWCIRAGRGSHWFLPDAVPRGDPPAQELYLSGARDNNRTDWRRCRLISGFLFEAKRIKPSGSQVSPRIVQVAAQGRMINLKAQLYLTDWGSRRNTNLELHFIVLQISAAVQAVIVLHVGSHYV